MGLNYSLRWVAVAGGKGTKRRGGGKLRMVVSDRMAFVSLIGPRKKSKEWLEKRTVPSDVFQRRNTKFFFGRQQSYDRLGR
jgi:hypothetical protein